MPFLVQLYTEPATHMIDLRLLDRNPIAELKKVKGEQEPVQGPYRDEQVNAAFAQVGLSPIPRNIGPEERLIYRSRLTAFITALLNLGADAVDNRALRAGPDGRAPYPRRRAWRLLHAQEEESRATQSEDVRDPV
jgi:hypothetical protein